MLLLSDDAGSMVFYTKNGIYLSILCKQYLLMWNAGICLMAYRKKKRQAIPVFLEAVFFLFLIFFPVISGMTVKVGHITSYLQWFETWQFVVMGGGA